MAAYSISEIISFAIKMEEKGREFYEYASENTADSEIKKVFSILAEEETRHKAAFEKLLEKTRREKRPGSGAKENLNYLAAYLESRSVFRKKDFERTRGRMFSIRDAVRFAMDREIDSVALYSGMRMRIQEKHQELFDRIIDEEVKHFLKLSKAEKMLRE